MIDKKFCFGVDAGDDYISLKTTIGEIMDYVHKPSDYIDFPGEYEVDGYVIDVYAGKADKLNYIVQGRKHTWGLIQNAKVLGEDEVEDVDYWLFDDDAVAKKLDQMEYEGEKIDLRTI